MINPNTYAGSVAALVRDAMAASDCSTLQLSKGAAIAYATLTRRLAGASPGFTVEEMKRIADYLGVGVRSLMADEVAA